MILGPFSVDNWGDYLYVVDGSGGRMAEVDGEDARKKADQICAALNAAYYMALATGETNG